MARLKKISVVCSVLVAFLVAFFVLYVFLDTNSSDLKKSEKEFFARNFDSQKKILILGSSHTGHLNATYLDQYLLAHQKDYVVYNLSIMGDRPQQRLGSIDKIISIKPDLVIYGVGYRDFKSDEFKLTNNLSSTKSILPDPQEFVRKILKLHLLTGYDLNFFQSPKGITLRVLHDITQPPNQSDKLFVQDTPFFHPEPKDIKINLLTVDEQNKEKQDIQKSFTGIDPPEKNIDALAIKEIANKLNAHNIKLVVFSTPYKKSYFELQPETYDEYFDSILDELNESYGVKIYKLHDRYENFTNIWTDFNHIALDPSVTIFDDDVGEIMLKEIG